MFFKKKNVYRDYIPSSDEKVFPINQYNAHLSEEPEVLEHADTDDKLLENIKYVAKSDKGKLQISLVPMQILRDIAEVRMYGTNKYHTPSNWAIVEKERYIDALMRHLLAYLDDPKSVDEESGIPHYKHLACNMAFICEMERTDWEKRKQEIISKDENLMKRIEEENKILKNKEN